MCWAIQNNAKTDRNLFFGSKNLRVLAERLDDADHGVQAGSPLLLCFRTALLMQAPIFQHSGWCRTA
jgi:hypothetical protein